MGNKRSPHLRKSSLTPVFFTDRDLGKLFPELLRNAGICTEGHSDHFPDYVKDEFWLTEVGRKGWFCLTHDKRIRYRPHEKAAIMMSGLGLFVLVGDAKHQELAENFINTLNKVKKFIKKYPRPFIAKIYRPTKKPSLPSRARPGNVKLWVSHEDWLRKGHE